MPANTVPKPIYMQPFNIINYYVAAKIGKSLKPLKFCKFMGTLPNIIHIFSTEFCGKIDPQLPAFRKIHS